MGSAEHLTSWRHRLRQAPTGGTTGAPTPQSTPTGGRWLLLRALLAALASAYLTLLATLVGWSAVPAFWGWSTFVTDSGSMAPAVQVGDALVAAPDPAELAPGQIVVVHDPAVPGRLLSHRVHRVAEDGSLVLKGDANADPDSTPVPQDRVVGLVRLRVPYVGLPMTWWRTQDWLALSAWAAGTLLAVVGAATDPLKHRVVRRSFGTRVATRFRRVARSQRPAVVASSTVVLALATASLGAAPGRLGEFDLVSAKFSRTSANAANSYAAVPDFVAPDASAVVVAKTSPAGYLTGAVRPLNGFRVYANVSDTGNPPSGVSAVRADLSAAGGSTTAALTSGSNTIGGTTYGWSSAVQTAGMSTGAKSYSVSMTDTAGNTRTRTPSPVDVDGTPPAAAAVSGLNRSGGIVGRPENGDTLVLTYTEAIDPWSVVSGWTGANRTGITVRFTRTIGTNIITVLSGASQLPLGSVTAANYSAGVDFTNSTMTLSGSMLSVVLGTPSVTAGTIGATAMRWTPSIAAFDAAGNNALTTAVTEGDNDADF